MPSRLGSPKVRRTNLRLPVLSDENGVRQISPTDVAQFIRLEQCQRYLRLRLHERSANRRFMQAYGVVPQALPPLLTRSGTEFEDAVEQAIRQRHTTMNFGADVAQGGQRPADNERVVAVIRDLPPGQTLVVLQPRLEVRLGAWLIRGDVDVLRLERDASGALHVLIADIKSSAAAKIEHRLQVAFYFEMLATLLDQNDAETASMSMAILFRGPKDEDEGAPPLEQAARGEQRAAAEREFGVQGGLLDIVKDTESYRGSVRDLVTDPSSTAANVAVAEFAALPFHLSEKCDGCLYNEFCMKWSAERDDLSLLPHLSANEKNALQRAGIKTMRELATLKELPEGSKELTPLPEKQALLRRIAATWPVGPRLDELIHRARRYRRWKGDDLTALSYIPSKGYGSLPYCAPAHNPNLVRVYIDAQHDYLNDRVFMLGSLVAACEGGVERPDRRRSIVCLTDGPPLTAQDEERIFVHWIRDTVRAVVELAAPDEHGEPRAPVHIVFFDRFCQRVLLEGLARHFSAILGATPLYDFLTQLAAYDSPVATFLSEEIRELRNYPIVCQSLQAVAAYLKFDWNDGQPFRELFRERLFDFWGKLDRDQTPSDTSPWYFARSRFGSQIPLEYAYAAWQALEAPRTGQKDDFADYRRATPELLRAFQTRRLEAIEHITRSFSGNAQTEKRSFDLPNLATFAEKARTLAQALDEFVTIERHMALGAWKTARLAPPERRALTGQTLPVRYEEADQPPDVAAQNRENERRRIMQERYRQEYREAHPDATRVQLSAEQRKETGWSQDGLRLRLRLDCGALDCGLDEALALSTLRPGDPLVVVPRTTVDSRLPVEQQVPFTPTPKQMLYGTRGTLLQNLIERDGSGRATCGYVEVELRASYGNGWRGFAFGSMDRPFMPGERYTLDVDPNDWYGSWCAKVTEALCEVEPGVATGNTLYDRLTELARMAADGGGCVGDQDCRLDTVRWPAAAEEGQARFLAGLDALHAAGALHAFEPSKREFIASHGVTPLLLVQGPPGTGKSYAAAFALFARLQGALRADIDFRACLSCKTHAATDVLLANVVAVQVRLREVSVTFPVLFAKHFDARLLDVPLFRVRPRGASPPEAIPLYRHQDRPPGQPKPVDAINKARWCVVAVTPGGTYDLVREKWPKELFGHHWCDCLVLDEASQMNLPEAIMASLSLRPDGRVLVVGDHRQMPPIVQHAWDRELRRTFQEFRSYESLFQTLLPLGLPIIKFSESFRLHADMAEFLRREIYQQDGISYFSRNRKVLPAFAHADPLVAAVLAPEHPLVVVVHDEAQSQVRNPFEQALIAPVLEALAAEHTYALNALDGLGVVVPHRAQRAALQEAVPCLTVRDAETGAVTSSAVDTVERFQGSERTAILIGATESDREYLLASSEFLLDPRRLTVALSRAKQKLILVASQSIFSLFSADKEAFAHAQLWKNLLRRTCTVKLWEGDREGRHVTVWGNSSGAERRSDGVIG